MNRPFIKLLVDRCQLALGSNALVVKELEEVSAAFDNMCEILYTEPIRGEENHQESFDDPSVPPLSVYEGDE